MGYLMLGILLSGLTLGGLGAHSWTAAAYEADMAKAARESQKIFDANEKRIDTLSNELEVAKSEKNRQHKTIVKYVREVVERPVYRSDCIDDDGLRAVNSVITDRPLNTSEPATAVRAGDSVGGEDGQASGGEAGGAVEAAE